MVDRFDEVLDEAEVLTTLDAARAEVWVSGLLAEWDDTADLLALLAASGRQAAADVAHALIVVVPEAGAIADGLVASGLSAPDWAAHVGTAQALAAWAICDPFSGNTSVVVEYEHADGVRHSMLVEIEDEAAVDVLFGPPDLVDDAFDGSDTRSLSVEEIDVTVAINQISDALRATAAVTEPAITDEFQMNVALAAARVNLHLDHVALAVADMAATAPVVTASLAPAARRVRDQEETELDAAAVGTLRAALADYLVAPAAGVVDATAARGSSVRAALEAATGDDLMALADDRGVAGDVDDATLLARLAGSFVVPGELAPFSPPEREAIRSLEWADWLGAVIPLVRSGPGTLVDPEALVRNINRCPEVTTTVPARDAPSVAAIFATVLHAWELTGVIDEEGRLTEMGQWLLPRALLDAWGDDRAIS